MHVIHCHTGVTFFRLSRRVLRIVFVNLLGIGIAHGDLVEKAGGESEDGSVDGGVGETLEGCQPGVVAKDARLRNAGYGPGTEQPLVVIDDSGR